jgi:TPR repeat protein
MTGRGKGGKPSAKRKQAEVEIPDSEPEEDDGEESRQAKCARRIVKGLEEEYVCPIAQELFIDPVTAEDGRVYEREKIARWFEECEDDKSSSPVTNEPMGFQLFPAHLVKSTLARLVEAGTIVGPLVDTWKATMAKIDEERQKVARLKEFATNGDMDAMAELGISYSKGWLGLEKDAELAFKWNMQAAREGHATASCRTAIAYLKGKGVVQNERRGCEFMFTAAVLGSEHACEFVGYCYVNGLNQYPTDLDQARFWFKKMEACKHKDSVASTRERARKWMSRHGDPNVHPADTDVSEPESSEDEEESEVEEGRDLAQMPMEEAAQEEVVVLEDDDDGPNVQP